jgi:hypothetical protein
LEKFHWKNFSGKKFSGKNFIGKFSKRSGSGHLFPRISQRSCLLPRSRDQMFPRPKARDRRERAFPRR